MATSGMSPPMNLNGWTPIWVEDFNFDKAKGKVVGSPEYVKSFTGRKTGQKTSRPWQTGMYDNSILETKNSCLILNIATVTDARGTWPRVAAILPRLTDVSPYGVGHGRFTMRWSVPQPIVGYKMVPLLWPDSGDWPKDGEIDNPEFSMSLGKNMQAFCHRQDATQGSDQYHADSGIDGVGGWHTTTINWKPGSWRTAVCEMVVDGTSIGKWTERIPEGPMHWVWQFEPNLSTWTPPNPNVKGQVLIDWGIAYKAA